MVWWQAAHAAGEGEGPAGESLGEGMHEAGEGGRGRGRAPGAVLGGGRGVAGLGEAEGDPREEREGEARRVRGVRAGPRQPREQVRARASSRRGLSATGEAAEF